MNQNPVAGSIAQWNGGTYGHIAYVEAVTSTYIVITADNYGGGTDRLKILRTSSYMPDNFIHFKDTYIGSIVQWDGDTKAQKTAWRVGVDRRRHWLPSSSVYSCLINGGVTGPYVLPSTVLDTVMPDFNGSWASCGAYINGDGVVNILDFSILESEWAALATEAISSLTAGSTYWTFPSSSRSTEWRRRQSLSRRHSVKRGARRRRWRPAKLGRFSERLVDMIIAGSPHARAAGRVMWRRPRPHVSGLREGA